MEEEAEKKKEARMEAWGRDDFSVYKMHPGETVEIQVNTFVFLFKGRTLERQSVIWKRQIS